MRINLRGVEPDMTEHSLDVANVRASFEHQRRHGMAEDVARPALADRGRFHVLASKPAQVVRRKWNAIRSEKYDAIVGLPNDFGPKGIEVHVQPGQSPFSDWHHAVSLAFSFSQGRNLGYVFLRIAYWLDWEENSCPRHFCWVDHEVACNQLGGDLALHWNFSGWVSDAAWAAEEQYADVLHGRGDGQRVRHGEVARRDDEEGRI